MSPTPYLTCLLILIISDCPEERRPPGLGPGGVQHCRAGRVHHGDTEQRQAGRYSNQDPVLYSKHPRHQYLYEFCQQPDGKQVKQL